METLERKKFIDTIVVSLRKAAIEMEELQVQAALGKAEARDGYEVAKKKLNLFLHDSKSKIKSGKEKVHEIQAKIDELHVQLNLGKAETMEAFQIQKKKLLLALHDLEVTIKTNKDLKSIYAYLLIQIEMFKVQLEILEEKFDARSESAKDAFEKGKQEFNQFIEKTKAKYSKEELTKWEHFSGEVSEAFTHLKHAFVKP
jgi:hypothetical protein